MGSSIPIEIRDSWDQGLRFVEGKDLEIANFWAHDIDGNSKRFGTNQSCIYLSDLSGINRVHHYLTHDCFDRQEPGNQNNTNIVVFNSDRNIAGNYQVDHGTSYYSQQNRGYCMKFKHGNSLGVSEVDHNLLYNCQGSGLTSNDGNNHFHHNLVHNSGYCFEARNLGGNFEPTTNLVEYNTCIGTHGVHARLIGTRYFEHLILI